MHFFEHDSNSVSQGTARRAAMTSGVLRVIDETKAEIVPETQLQKTTKCDSS